jgi:hypothetical protein
MTDNSSCRVFIGEAIQFDLILMLICRDMTGSVTAIAEPGEVIVSDDEVGEPVTIELMNATK